MVHEWRDEYNLGLPKIDEQHKQMLDIMNELDEAIEAEKSKEELDDILHKLLKATKEHFKYEEGELDEHHYKDLDKHKVLHNAFEKRIENLIDSFEHGKELKEHLPDLLEEWLEHHIDTEDKKFVDVLKEN